MWLINDDNNDDNDFDNMCFDVTVTVRRLAKLDLGSSLLLCKFRSVVVT